MFLASTNGSNMSMLYIETIYNYGQRLVFAQVLHLDVPINSTLFRDIVKSTGYKK